MKIWTELYNSRFGEDCVIYGKGPAVDEWITSGRPSLGSVHIAINDSGSSTGPCDYNVSRHYKSWWGKIAGVWVMPIFHEWDHGEEYKSVRVAPLAFPAHWFIPVCDKMIKPSKEDIRDYRMLSCPGGSACVAIEFAFYLGCKSVTFIGVGSGMGYAKAYQERSEPFDYSTLYKATVETADRRFKNRYTFWEPNK